MNRQHRIDELLVQRATEGLNAAEQAELARLLELVPQVDEDCFDEAAALVALAAFDPRERMPESTLRALMRNAVSAFEPDFE